MQISSRRSLAWASTSGLTAEVLVSLNLLFLSPNESPVFPDFCFTVSFFFTVQDAFQTYSLTFPTSPRPRNILIKSYSRCEAPKKLPLLRPLIHQKSQRGTKSFWSINSKLNKMVRLQRLQAELRNSRRSQEASPAIPDSQVKVIDFGSSCYVDDSLTNYVQSRSYRWAAFFKAPKEIKENEQQKKENSKSSNMYNLIYLYVS